MQGINLYGAVVYQEDSVIESRLKYIGIDTDETIFNSIINDPKTIGYETKILKTYEPTKIKEATEHLQALIDSDEVQSDRNFINNSYSYA